ncbi:MAG TPA: VWA domain-containing protein [Beijerinckiaceae bacterium]|jgi:Flp pilus assembly protein TadG
MRNRIRSLLADEGGAVAALAALSLPIMVLSIGAAIDYSRAGALKTKLQDAADAAVLIAAKSAPSMTDTELLTAVNKAFKANVSDPTAKIDSLKVSNGRRKVELTVSATAKNMFLGFAGMGQQPVGAFSASVTADNNYEIALVIDNSGSMASSAGGKSKMQSAKDAANRLIDAMMASQAAANKTKFSVVPFTLAVNVGSQYANASWMDTTGLSSIHWQNLNKTASDWKPASRFAIFSELGISWAGCVETRPDVWAVTDGSPATATPDSLFVPMFAPDEPGDAADFSYDWGSGTWYYPNSYLNDNPKKECKEIKSSAGEYVEAQTKLCKYQNQSSLTTSGGRGPNYSCNAKPLLRLTSDATALHNAVNAMAADGNTNLLEGFMWGWRTLSPNAPFADGKPYKTVDNEKIVILLTDGMNAWSAASNHNKSIYSSFGYYGAGRLTDSGKANPTNDAEARAQMDAKTLTACTNAKNQGITVYTVGFSVAGAQIDAAGLDLLKKCASSPQMAYVANDSSAIISVFEEIAKSIGGLRLTQ